MNTNVNTFNCSDRLSALDQRLVFVTKQFGQPLAALYGFLGDCYGLVRDIGSDGAKVESLKECLKKLETVSERQIKVARTVASKVALRVFHKDSGDLVNKSTRSLYKTAMEKASDENLTVKEFVDKLKALGVVGFVRGEQSNKKTDKEVSNYVDKKRKELLSSTIKGVSEIGLIGNKNPKDVFALVVYRVDGNKLVPCFTNDDTQVIDGMLNSYSPIERKKHNEIAELMAIKAKQEYLKKVA